MRLQRRWRLVLLFATHTVLGTALYAGTFGHGFVLDDEYAVASNADVLQSTPISELLVHDYWGTPMGSWRSHKSYRPITVMSFRWNALIGATGDSTAGGLSAPAFHVVNACLHGIVSGVFAVLAGSLGPSSERRGAAQALVALGASLLFACHPVHVEAVANVSGRAEMLAALFFLLALAVGRQRQGSSLALAVACALLAMLSKEQGVMALPVLASWEILDALLAAFHHRPGTSSSPRNEDKDKAQKFTAEPTKISTSRHLCRAALWACSFGALVRLRVFAVGGGLPTFDRFQNPLQDETMGATARFLTLLHAAALHIGLLMTATPMAADRRSGANLVVQSWSGDPRAGFDALLILGTVIAPILLLCWRIITSGGAKGRRGARGWRFSSNRAAQAGRLLAWFSLGIIAWLPASNIFFPVGFLVAERVMYIPSLGFCLIASEALWGLAGFLAKATVSVFRRATARRLAHAFFLGMVCLASLHAARMSWVRSRDWQSLETLLVANLRVFPQNAWALGNLAALRRVEGQLDAAYKLSALALSADPGFPAGHIEHAKALEGLGRVEEASNMLRDLLRNSAKRNEVPPEASLFLGQMCMKLGRFTEAREHLAAAVEMGLGQPEVRLNLALIPLLIGNYDVAEQELSALLSESETEAALWSREQRAKIREFLDITAQQRGLSLELS